MENNKRVGRRAIGGLITIILVTVAYYVTMLTEATIDWFKIYTGVVLIIYGLAVGGRLLLATCRFVLVTG